MVVSPSKESYVDVVEQLWDGRKELPKFLTYVETTILNIVKEKIQIVSCILVVEPPTKLKEFMENWRNTWVIAWTFAYIGRQYTICILWEELYYIWI